MLSTLLRHSLIFDIFIVAAPRATLLNTHLILYGRSPACDAGVCLPFVPIRNLISKQSKPGGSLFLFFREIVLLLRQNNQKVNRTILMRLVEDEDKKNDFGVNMKLDVAGTASVEIGNVFSREA